MTHRTFDRSPWLLAPDISFLNHGSFGGCPEPVLEAQRAWRDRLEQEPVRFLDRELEGHLDQARTDVAAFLEADADGLAFVPNATTGVSTVLASVRFKPGDELMASDHEYNATLNALRAAAERDGATVVIVQVPFPIQDPAQALEAYLDAVTPRTRFALVSHVTSPTALVLPVAALVRELNRRGVDTLVDAAHAPGMVPVGLEALGAAYWTGNAHKWLCAPKGAGMLHVRSDVRPAMRPLVTSHGANSDRTDRSRFRLTFDWTGTTDPTPWLSIPAAIRYVGGLHADGWPGLMAANAALARDARDRLCTALEVPAPAPDTMLGSMAAIPLGGLAPTPVAAAALQAALFDEERIEVAVFPFPVPAALPTGGLPSTAIVRVSAQHYNRPEEYEALAASLARRLRAARSPRSLLGRRRRG
ncbi:MAG: aminotransferase class V-fold PLP-dependent enzyme [Chloroflexi bacterium]|nr:aminotransferase class V-fold PLP-dependent enzyme [Chloroflexota bacterium]